MKTHLKQLILFLQLLCPALLLAADLPEHWPIKELEKRPIPSRIHSIVENGSAGLLVSVLDERLDLATRLRRAERSDALVPLAPRLVVGQGPNAGNHTLVKIPYFFVQVNLAVAHATVSFLSGRRMTVWTPSQR